MKIKNLTGPVNAVYAALKAELEESGLPVLVFGNSDVAIVMSSGIEKAAIFVHAVTVGDQYWKPNCQLLGQSVIPFSVIKRRFKRINVIGCFTPLYEGVISELKNSGIVENLYLPFFDILNFFSFDADFVRQHSLEFNELKDSFVDNLSADTFDRYIYSKVEGDTTALTPVIANNQYFPEDLFKLYDEEIFVDCGAFTGDSIADFTLKVNGRFRKIIAFEPDKVSFQKLVVNTQSLQNIELIHGGLWDSKCMLSFDVAGGGLSRVKDEGVNEVCLDTLDNVLKGEDAHI